jgi:excisionase family DNA binding protein
MKQRRNKMEQITKKKYRVKELCSYLGVSKTTIWRWASEGKIKAHKIGPKVTVFDIDEVNEALFGIEK